jgi:type VI secretion system secreted protein Hcp
MKRILLLAALLFSIAPTRAAVDMFLKVTAIPGESTAIDHKDEIEIYSYSFGINNTTVVASGGISGGKAVFRDLSLTKRVDKSSPPLMLACAQGKHLAEAILTIQRSGGADKPSNFMRITLTDVIVSSISSAGAAGGDVPQESISFNYGKIKIEYFQQLGDGSVVPAGIFTWDLVASKAV